MLIDSGASRCIFHADVGRGVGFDIEKGEQEQTTGISGEPTTIYIHNVGLHVGADIIRIKAGFCSALPLAGLLGRRGFLDHFKVTLDASTYPPGFDVERIHRV